MIYIDFAAEYGNGANNTSNLALAIDRIRTAGGGRLHFRSGRYLFGRTALRSSMHLFDLQHVDITGDGFSTILEWTGPVDEMDTRDYYCILLERAQYCTIRNLVLDGHSKAGYDEQTHAIQFLDDVDHIEVENVYTRNWRGDGLKVIGQGTENDGRTCDFIGISGFRAENNGRSGITIQRRFDRSVIQRCFLIGNGDQAFDCEPTGSSAGSIKISDSFVEHTSPSDAITLSNTYGMVLDNIEVRNGTIQGINVRNAQLNKVRVYALDIPSNRHGIKIFRGSEDVRFVDCEVESRWRAISLDYNNGVWPRDIKVEGGRLRGGTGIAGEVDHLRVVGTTIDANVAGEGRAISLTTPPYPEAERPGPPARDWKFYDVTIRGGFEYGIWMRADNAPIEDVEVASCRVYDTPVKTLSGTVVGAPFYARHYAYPIWPFVTRDNNGEFIHTGISIPPELQ